MSNTTNILENGNSLCRDYLDWFENNNCEFQSSPSCNLFVYNGDEIRGEDLQNIDSFCRRDSADNSFKNTQPAETDDKSFWGITGQIGLGIIAIAIGVVFILASKIRKKMREAKHEARLEGRTFNWVSEIWNSAIKVSSDIGKKAVSVLKTIARVIMPWKWKFFSRSENPAPNIENPPVSLQNENSTPPDKVDSDEGDEGNVMFYPTAVKPSKTVVTQQFGRFLRSGNGILLGIYAGMAISKWGAKTREEQRRYWKRDMQHSKGIGREVGSLPFSFVKEFVLIDIQRTNTMLGGDPESLVAQLNTDPQLAASGIDITPVVYALQDVKGLLLDHYVNYPPDEDMVSKQITANYRSVSVKDEPNLLPFITRITIGEWLSMEPARRVNFIDKVSTIPEPGGLPKAFIRYIMKRLNLQNPHRREDVLDFAPVFHQIAALDPSLKGEKYKKIQELADIVYASWNSIAPSITKIFGARKKWGGLPAQFIRLARFSVEAIAQPPVIYVKEEPWSVKGKGKKELYEGINLAQVKGVITQEIPEFDEYPQLLNMSAVRVADDWNSAPPDINNAFRQRDAEASLIKDAQEINKRIPRPFIALWFMVNGGLSVMSKTNHRLAIDEDDDDDPEDPNGNGAPVGGNGFSESNGGQMGSPDSTKETTSATANNSNIMPQGAVMAAGGPVVAAPAPPQQTLLFGGAILSPMMFSPMVVIPA